MKIKHHELILHGLGIGDKYTLNKDLLKLTLKSDCHTIKEIPKTKGFTMQWSDN
jgi:hypothetical protein